MSGIPRADRQAALRQGLIDLLPAAPGMAAWGLVTGVAMAQSSLRLSEAVGLSALAYAGSAQLAALPLLVAGAPVAVTVLTALMVNLRFVIYSAALSPSLRAYSFRQRLGLAYMVSDVGFVVYMRHEHKWREAPTRHWYFAGVGVGIFFVWHICSLIGLFASTAFPREWGLDFAGLLAMLALLVPMLATRPGLAGSVTAGGLSIALAGLPYRLGVVVSILAGIAVAVFVDPHRKAAK
jgi:predicted branched-subunit amino acid permease